MDDATFLRAICDDPDDDVSRLAYADWLTENGAAARGEFIQVQVRLARRAEGLGSGNPADWAEQVPTAELKLRERALLAAHRDEWARPVAGLVVAYQFRKGFVEHVTLSTAGFLSKGSKLFKLAPVRRVRFLGGVSQKLAESPLLAWLDGLDFSGSHMSDAGLRTLLASPHLDRVSWLDLSQCSLTNRGLAELADHPLLAQLTHLNLGYNALGLPAVQALFGSPHWGTVRTLVLTGNYYLDSRAQEFLAQSLQGAPDPALLRSLLLMASREDREYTGAAVRDIAGRASGRPDLAVAILTDGLRDGRRKVRAASARLLAQLGAGGAEALPGLVQRLFERDPRVRDLVAPALARLLPELPAEVQHWLCRLANPLLPATTVLRHLVAGDGASLPGPVRDGLTAVCDRRAAWWAKVGDAAAGPGEVGLGAAVADVLERAGRHAGRHVGTTAARDAAEAGRRREAAWLLARATELVQALTAGGPATCGGPAAVP